MAAHVYVSHLLEKIVVEKYLNWLFKNCLFSFFLKERNLYNFTVISTINKNK